MQWTTWSACTNACGLGNHTRTVSCVDAATYHNTGVATVEVPLALCREPAPESARACLLQPCEPTLAAYTLGVWDGCTLPCGGGVQSRTLGCVDATGDVVPVTSCEYAGVPTPAQAVRACNAMPCEEFKWKAGEWHGCSKSCGGGVRVREVRCVGSRGGESDDGVACAGATPARPAQWEACNAQACTSTPVWDAQPWGDCSPVCGGGTAARTVTCIDAASGATLADTACSAMVKPATTRACNSQLCQATGHRWLPGAWGVCSGGCGTAAVRTRSVACVSIATGTAVAASNCAGQRVPAASAPCGDGPCNACAALNGTCAAPRGSCVAGACVCTSGFFGSFCRSTSTRCPTGRLDSAAVCCESGVLTRNGAWWRGVAWGGG